MAVSEIDIHSRITFPMQLLDCGRMPYTKAKSEQDVIIPKACCWSVGRVKKVPTVLAWAMSQDGRCFQRCSDIESGLDRDYPRGTVVDIADLVQLAQMWGHVDFTAWSPKVTTDIEEIKGWMSLDHSTTRKPIIP